MGDIAVRVHSEGNESHEITTPDEMISAEFISELVRGLRFPETDEGKPILWEVDDKDNGLKLIRERTLRENGVLEGHNLYLRRARLTRVVEHKPVEGKPVQPVAPTRPERPRPGWLLWVALMLIPAAGIAGYFGAESQTEKLRAQLHDERVRMDGANKTNAAAEANARKLETDLEQARHDLADKDVAITKLQSDLSSKDALIAAKDKRIAVLTAQASQFQADSARKDEQIRGLEASVQRLQQTQSELVALQQVNANLNQRVQSLQQISAGLRQQIQNEQNRQHFGFLKWTGNAKNNVVDIAVNKSNIGSVVGSLPGGECSVQAADPEHVLIVAPPGPANKWSRVSFTVKGNGVTTVTLIWTVK